MVTISMYAVFCMSGSQCHEFEYHDSVTKQICPVQHCQLCQMLQVIRRAGELALSELTHRVGLMAGSTSIDDMFQKHVREIFGPQNFDAWIAEHPQMFSKMKHKVWEDAKKQFDGSQDIVIDMPGKVMKSLPDEVRSPEFVPSV